MTKKKGEKDYTQFTRWYVNTFLQSSKVQMFIVLQPNSSCLRCSNNLQGTNGLVL